ncbi:hypothetical protein [Chitinophaga barathri]|uniref:DUF1896 family protein n=1 Tax=Chitinophaga barathri TaxID=1647451 RepID=A0A3N4MSI6_9BACT|nr:hypothetical protein [Chitinophaga barathri]RPD43100.1 hypothetical protein EG028_02055 [Chitinophaga barathri]
MQYDIQKMRSEIREQYLKFLSQHYQPLLENLCAQGKYDAFFKEDWELVDSLIDEQMKEQIPPEQIVAYCLDLQIQHSGPSQMDLIEMLLRTRLPEIYKKWTDRGSLRDLILKVARKGAYVFELVRFDDPASPFYYLDATLVEFIGSVHREEFEADDQPETN